MKNIGIFYLIFVVLLSVLPCSDELKAAEPTQQAIVQVEHNDQGSTEACSPICTCTCCGQSVVAIAFIDFSVEVPLATPAILVTHYQFSLQQMPVNIWQPPKLAIIA